MSKRLRLSASSGSALMSSTVGLYVLHAGCARGDGGYCFFVSASCTAKLLPKSTHTIYTARVGGGARSGSCGDSPVRFGCLQSIPSSNIDNCAALRHTVPLCA